jgi:hypothetical protein
MSIVSSVRNGANNLYHNNAAAVIDSTAGNDDDSGCAVSPGVPASQHRSLTSCIPYKDLTLRLKAMAMTRWPSSHPIRDQWTLRNL